MNISEIQAFFDYQPVFDEKPQFLVDQIKQIASSYLKSQQLDGIQKAYEFALKSHEAGVRLSGESYIVHPLKATLFLMDIKPDLATIQTCILHDVIEDTDVTYDDVKNIFGEEVAELCEGLVKVAKVRYQWEDRQIETIKKTFLAMSKDLRVIFVKIADRIHNIQTLHYHPKQEKRERIAEETMKIFVPIAKRLGLYRYQTYLENGAFKNLNPDAFEQVIAYVKKQYGWSVDYIQKGKKVLSTMLGKEKVKYSAIKGRLKSPYRIYEKLDKKYKTLDFSNVLDVLAFRVITHSIADCYNALGIIHSNTTPLIKKIKDYIAVPKFNDYKSLHTTVLGMFSFPIEIQIRTEEMDEVAEYGVAAHFWYSESGGSVLMTEKQTNWIKKLQDVVNNYTSLEYKDNFKTELNIELLEKNIFVYTPKGTIIELPQGSTVLDFAFRIHTDFGLKFKNALVNGMIKSINYELKTGEVLQISAHKNKYTATKHRLEYLHTPTAKAKLVKYLHTLEKDEIMAQGIRRMSEKLKEYGLPPLYSQDDLITRVYKNEERENLILNIFEKQQTPHAFLKTLYPQIKSLQPLPSLQVLKKSESEQLVATVIVDGDKILPYSICPECAPVLGEKIIAKSNKDGIKIHALTCKALKTLSYEKILEAHRVGQLSQEYILKLTLLLPDKPGILLKLFQLLSELHINIDHITTENIDKEWSNVLLEISYMNPANIWLLLNDLKKNDDFIKIVKKEIF